ncbi:MAG TPA: sulfotransferase [Candidatus Eremiobacteraceae bacterium]|nr:sulfotransferase [Candidatus Eremiobacteraceae bacterium]
MKRPFTFRDRLRSALLIDFGGGPASTVLLAGSQRSGTTWAANLINYDHRYRDMYEPFNGDRVERSAMFRYALYLRPDDPAPAYARLAADIVGGRLRHPRVDRTNARRFSTRRLIKETRVNLILAWLQRRFPAMPVVFLVRHPCAVAVSRMALGWKPRLEAMLDQPELVADHLKPFMPVISQATEPFEQHVVNWCIDNYVPARALVPENLHAVFYESLVARPEEELRLLFAAIGRPYSAAVLDTLSRPSRTVRPDSAIRTGGDAAGGWRTKVDAAMIDRAMYFVTAFGMDRWYGPDAMPRQPRPLPFGRP